MIDLFLCLSFTNSPLTCFAKMILLAIFIPLLTASTVLSDSSAKSDLVFSQSLNDQHLSNNMITIMRYRPVVVDAVPDRQQMIFVEKLNSLQFRCQTMNLKQDFSITKALLCLKEGLNAKPECVDVTSKNIAQFPSGRFSISFDPLKGFVADLKLEESEKINGYLYCQLYNSIEHVESNFVEIVNLKHLSNLINVQQEPILRNQVVNVSLDGIIIDCGKKSSDLDPALIPEWQLPMAGLQFNWFLCTTKMSNFDFCYEPLKKSLRENEQYRLLSNYSLQLFKGSLDNFHNHIYLQCSSMNSTFYSFHELLLSKNPQRTTVKHDENISIHSPQRTFVEFREGKWPRRFYRINAFYQSSSVSFMWLKDGKAISDSFHFDNHTLKFPATITPDLGGNYTLEINQISPPNQKVVFQFNVKVISLPSTVEDFDSTTDEVVYVMMGKSLDLSIRFHANKGNTSIMLNEFVITITDANQQLRDLDKVKIKYPYLEKMSVKLTEFKDDKFTEIRYRGENIRGLWFKNGLSHRVTFIGSNSIGVTRRSTLVKAIEKPRWKVRLSDFLCSENCLSSEVHTFKCAVFSKEYADVGLKIDYQWRINGMTLETLFGAQLMDIYFSVEGETLIVKKIATANHARDMRVIEKMQNATLSCSVLVLIPNIKESGDIQLKELYNSWNEPTHAEYCQTKIDIVFSDVLQGGALSNVVWIIGIPLVLLSVISTVLICWQYFRSRSHTYNIDHNERIAGKDPEKETFETLYFQHYTREEATLPAIKEDHSLWSVHSSKQDIKEVGSYDIDAEVYDEGSIIGEYANEGRK